jgi:hypothetical protein
MCGERVLPEPPPPRILAPEPAEPDRLWRWWWLAAAAAVLVGVGLLAALLGPGTDDGADPQGVGPTVAPDEPLDGGRVVALTVEVAGCPGCEIIAVPADGTTRQSATVPDDGAARGNVVFALPKASSAGLALMVVHPDRIASAGGTNIVVLRPEALAAGEAVGRDAVARSRLSDVCWAGTTGDAATLPLTVEVLATPAGGTTLLAWADPAVATLGESTPTLTDGSVGQQGLDSCRLALAVPSS